MYNNVFYLFFYILMIQVLNSNKEETPVVCDFLPIDFYFLALIYRKLFFAFRRETRLSSSFTKETLPLLWE